MVIRDRCPYFGTCRVFGTVRLGSLSRIGRFQRGSDLQVVEIASLSAVAKNVVVLGIALA
jgi:hypothetical protein